MRLAISEKQLFVKKLGIALIALGSATVITLLVPPLSNGGMYFLFLTAIIFSTLHGDVRLGFWAAASSLLINLFLLYYLDKAPRNFGDWLVLFAFGLASGFTVYLCHAQMKSELARHEAESKYRAIFENAITGIYETTLAGQYVKANPKLASILGFDSPQQLMLKTTDLSFDFYVEQHRRAEFAERVRENGHLAAFESEIYRRDGEKIWITENGLAVRDDKGNLIGFQGTTIEITARKRAEAALQEAHEKLEGKVVERTIELDQTNKILLAEIAERKRVEEQLMLWQQQLRDLSAYLQSVREDERKYIARELHDELGQTLTALKIDLTRISEKIADSQNAVMRAQIAARIPAMLEIVDMAMETTRKIVAELRPAILDELGLAAAAEWQVQEFQKRTGIRCELNIDLNENELDQDLTIAMFRILQECLTNITRHAAATEARITLKNQTDVLLLEIADNGRGISNPQLEKKNSFGILGMRERALLLGGTLQINRRGQGGTRVTIRIPRDRR